MKSRSAAAIVVAVIATMSPIGSGAANAVAQPDDEAVRIASSSTGRAAKSAEATAELVFDRLTSSRDAEATFESLSPNDRAAFEARYLPAASKISVTLTPLDDALVPYRSSSTSYDSAAEALAVVAASKKCYAGFAKYTALAALGYALWDTYTEGKYCGNGKTVTSATFNRSWSSIAAFGWRDGGQLGKGAGVVDGQARIWSQRRMIFGTGGWDIQTQQPCVRINGKANGTGVSRFVCSIYG